MIAGDEALDQINDNDDDNNNRIFDSCITEAILKFSLAGMHHLKVVFSLVFFSISSLFIPHWCDR